MNLHCVGLRLDNLQPIHSLDEDCRRGVVRAAVRKRKWSLLTRFRRKVQLSRDRVSGIDSRPELLDAVSEIFTNGELDEHKKVHNFLAILRCVCMLGFSCC